MNVGAQMRIFREALELTRDEFSERFGISKSTLVGYELGKRTPNVDGLDAFIRAGINAMWLLTGKGPMLFADLVKPSVVVAPPSKINVDAMVQAFCVTFQTAPKGETVEQSARKAVAFYQYCLDQGLITPEGEGEGSTKSAA